MWVIKGPDLSEAVKDFDDPNVGNFVDGVDNVFGEKVF
jgi:hypothetical protein